MKQEAAKLTEWQLGLLKELTSVDSPSNDVEGNADVVTIVKRELAVIGARIECERFYDGVGTHLVAVLPATRPEAPKVILSGHLDTVFPRGQVAAHPFHIDGDFAYGLGIADCKGSVAVSIGAIKVLQALGRQPNAEIRFVFTCDEERGSPTGREVIETEAKKADYAIGFEPARGGNGVITFRPGYVTARIQVKGVKSHAFNGYDKGVSAPYVLAEMLLALKNLNQSEKGILYTPYDLKSGKDLGSVVDTAETGVLVPYFDKTALPDIERDLTVTLPALAAKAGATAEVTLDKSAALLQERNAASLALYERFRRAGDELGIEVKEEKAFAPSDLNEYSSLGLPAVDGLGPYCYGMHVLDEHIRISSLAEKTALVAAVLASF